MVISIFFVMVSIIETVMESHYYFRVIYHNSTDKTGVMAPDPEEFYARQKQLQYSDIG